MSPAMRSFLSIKHFDNLLYLQKIRSQNTLCTLKKSKILTPVIQFAINAMKVYFIFIFASKLPAEF